MSRLISILQIIKSLFSLNQNVYVQFWTYKGKGALSLVAVGAMGC